MARQGRSHGSRLAQRFCALAAMSLIVPVLGQIPRGVAAESAAIVDARPEFNDAELADVCFVDAEHGWAVGDRGVIWHTDDGGASWRLQASGVTCRLNSVQFLDRQQGWAAGGAALPPGDLSRGVILITRDGGRTWSAVNRLTLPAVRRMRFFDPLNGWCLGESSGLFPSGAAITSDGGRTWSPIVGDGRRGWTAGAFADPLSGSLAGAAGSLASVRRQAIEDARVPRLGLRAIRSLQLGADGRGWLAGDAGLILATVDGGRSWQAPAGEPPAIADQIDWRAVAVHGDCIWMAGSPGSCVLRSCDNGKSWSLERTGQTLPLTALHFVDPEQGWAVGVLGTILATADGGRSWRQQRAGGTRAAWLAVFAEPRELPLEVWGRLSAGDGYLSAVELIARRDTASDARDEVVRQARAEQALVELGASSVSTAWRFPLGPVGLPLSAARLLEQWDGANDGRAIALLEEHLVRRIRAWRPEIIVTHAAYPRGDHPLEHLVNQAVLGAVEAAADATRHAGQIAELGLSAWQVKKVFGGPAPLSPQAIRLHASELIPRLNESLGEMTEGARSVLGDPPVAPDHEIGFRLYLDRLPQQAGGKDFFAGIVLQPGGDARRRLGIPDPGAIERRRQLAIRTRNLQAVLDRTARAGRGDEAVGAIAGLVQDLDAPLAGRVLYRLALDYVRQGKWDLAADAMTLLSRQYPEHPLAVAALVWQVHYGASCEIAWRRHGDQRLLAERISAGDDAPNDQVIAAAAEGVRPVQGPANVERANLIGVDHRRTERDELIAIDAARRLEELDPARIREPNVVLPLARAYRMQGLHHDSERMLLSLRQTRPRDAWWICAAGELWLARPEGPCPKPIASCAKALERPKLDGELDDAVWQQAMRIDLVSAADDDAPWPAAALLAYDREFLYMAVSCRQAAGVDYSSESKSRPRDADLSGRDRVELLLDLDRDAATWFRLTVDDRGWTNDACGDDASWNPQWYVASKTVDGVWTVEAAIGFDQLTRDFPRSKSAWSIGLQRVVPGTGFQSWTRPAAPTVVPEGFGYLIFD